MIIGNEWDEILKEEYEKPYFTALMKAVDEEYATKTVYPPRAQVYSAMAKVPYDKVRVVILGQDPYHGPGQAHGLCFSVKEGVPHPPSLKNIFKELESELGIAAPESGELVGWAKQGVLLLNTTLTVREGSPQSHKGRGWEILTDRIISIINEKQSPVVFMLWGGNARTKKALITNPKHLVLECAHPSPLSAYAGFFGCGHFASANDFLSKNGLSTIEWDKINDYKEKDT